MDDRNSQRRINLKKITLTEQQKKFLSDHADNERPNESCAVLFGSVIGDDAVVSEVFLTENTEKNPQNFTISNEELMQAYRVAEEKKTSIVGIFHSHPDSEAYPSDTDRKFMHSNPVVWVIYSGSDMEFRAFVLEGKVKEVPIL